MEFGLGSSVNLCRSRVFLWLSAFPLLLLLLLHSEALVVKICSTLCGPFNGGPVSVFLLMNCLIATIIASSKTGSNSAGNFKGHGSHELGQTEPATEEDIGYKHTYVKENLPINEKERINENNQEEHALNTEVNNGTETVIRAIKVDNQKQQEVISHIGENIQAGVISATSSIKRTGVDSVRDDEEARFAQQVRAAKLSSKKGTNQLLHSATDNPIDGAGLALSTAGAVNAATAAATAINTAVAATADQAATATLVESPAAAKTLVDDEDDERWPVEELNRRAEEFIARFNHQMRLQRLESLQRRRHRRSRNCHNRHHQHQHQVMPLQRPLLLAS